MRLLRTAWDRLEPWALFLSILGIVFVPWGKSLWWAVVILVSLIRVVRAWRQSGTYFSLETMSDVIGAGTCLLFAIALYFFFHQAWPGLVHDQPDVGGLVRDDYVIRWREGGTGRLAIARANEHFKVRVWRERTGVPDLHAVLRMRDLTRASGEGFRSPVPLGELRGRLAETGPGTLDFGPDGEPVGFLLIQRGETRLQGRIERP